MSILVRFAPDGLTAERYDSVSAGMQESGDWPPEGLLTHVCFGESGSLRVSEIWDSLEQMQAFGEKLGPVLAEAGIEMSSEPEVFPIHNIEQY
ncbi:MAG TPA: hypothetical protein VNT22_10510 [Baekduia sp.]|nr:hypothetical protein [Baekduia sp.]